MINFPDVSDFFSWKILSCKSGSNKIKSRYGQTIFEYLLKYLKSKKKKAAEFKF